jgi:hypothetical protein
MAGLASRSCSGEVRRGSPTRTCAAQGLAGVFDPMTVMTKAPDHDAFNLMRTCLRHVLPVMVVHARTARNPAAKQQARSLVNEIREALQAAAEEAE